MTTAQMASRINLDLYREYECPVTIPAGVRPARTGAARAAGRGRRLSAAGLLQSLTHKMERDDTLGDRLAGYGLCGLTMFYLAGHVVKAIFG